MTAKREHNNMAGGTIRFELERRQISSNLTFVRK